MFTSLRDSNLLENAKNIHPLAQKFPHHKTKHTAKDADSLHFCSLLLLRHKLLCCPSEWVTESVSVIIELESKPTMNSADFNPIFPREMLLCYIFRTSVVKYDILSNKRRSKHVISSQLTCEIHCRTSLNKTQTFLPHLWITTLLPCYDKMIFLSPVRGHTALIKEW